MPVQIRTRPFWLAFRLFVAKTLAFRVGAGGGAVSDGTECNGMKTDGDETPVNEVEVVRLFLQRHGTAIALALLVVVALAAGLTSYRRWSRGRRERSVRELGMARSVQDLEALIERYPGSTAASVALLRLAKEQYNLGRYDLALRKYDEFLKKYPEHVFAPAAELGRVHGLEARGQLREALDGYRAFAARHPGHHLEPQAVLGEARCLEDLGRLEDARIVYEDFLAGNPDSIWSARAEESLEEVRRRLSRSSETVSAPPREG